MARLPASVVVAALIAASSAALAQNVTTTTSTVDNVKMTGCKGAAKNANTDSSPDLSTALQSAHPVLPNLSPPQSGDSHG
jgi:hypothetical protein